jgi:uncharacterized membrane protein YgaE (UPF0421/DUF939 family)
MMRWQERWVEMSQRSEKGAAFSFALRAALASVGAVLCVHLLHVTQGMYALIAAVVVSDAAPEAIRHLGTQRLLGTALGAVLGGVLAVLCGHALWAVGLAIFLTILVCQLLHFKDAAKVGGYVAGVVIVGYAAAPWRYAWDRFLETAVGIAFAILVCFVLPVPKAPANGAPAVK